MPERPMLEPLPPVQKSKRGEQALTTHTNVMFFLENIRESPFLICPAGIKP
jgi:hypothetical protein